MKRYVVLLLIPALMFSGCASAQLDDPFKVDTVIQIPVDPTEEPTEEQTLPPTEASTESLEELETEPTQPAETKPKSSGSSKNNGSGSGKSPEKTKPKATEPPETEPQFTLTTPPTEPPSELPFDPSVYHIGSLENAILNELNFYRGEEGVVELPIITTLCGIAYLRAQEGSISWSHTRPDGRDYTSVLSDYDYGYGESAELMVYASGNGDAAAIVAKWMSSDSHSAKILCDRYTEVGIGAYREGGMTYVVCLLVG